MLLHTSPYTRIIWTATTCYVFPIQGNFLRSRKHVQKVFRRNRLNVFYSEIFLLVFFLYFEAKYFSYQFPNIDMTWWCATILYLKYVVNVNPNKMGLTRTIDIFGMNHFSIHSVPNILAVHFLHHFFIFSAKDDSNALGNFIFSSTKMWEGVLIRNV